jgi:hypothetical protein
VPELLDTGTRPAQMVLGGVPTAGLPQPMSRGGRRTVTRVEMGELAARLYSRLGSRLSDQGRRDIETLMREDAYVAVSDLLFFGIDHNDLKPDEVQSGIALARSGQFWKLGDWVLERLTDYQKHAAGV